MADIKEFNGYIVNNKKVKDIVCFPYDVLSEKDVLKFSKNKDSFSNVIRSEALLPNKDKYDKSVYKKSKEILEQAIKNKNFIKSNKKELYLYKQTFDENVQTGLISTIAIDDYKNNVVKKHELTRIEKETDRINHFYETKFNTEPVFLVYKENKKIKSSIESEIKKSKPILNFTYEKIKNEIFVIDDTKVIENIKEIFKNIDSLYIADGHHRAKASYEVGKKLRTEKKLKTKSTTKLKANSKTNKFLESDYFLGVLFPSTEVKIIDYNRVIFNVNKTKEDLLSELEKNFIVKETGKTPYAPKKKNEFGFYFKKAWYKIEIKKTLIKNLKLPDSLDVSILQNFALENIFKIKNPRKDKNIDFFGGSRGLKYLEKVADEKNGAAFSLFPVDIKDILSVSDKGLIMPPKSTWFIPKLLSGIILHKLV